MEALAVPARCCVAVWFVRRSVGPGLRRGSRIPSLGIVGIGTVFLFATADFTAPFQFVDQRREATSPACVVGTVSTTSTSGSTSSVLATA